jgi:hypothetical protein
MPFIISLAMITNNPLAVYAGNQPHAACDDVNALYLY